MAIKTLFYQSPIMDTRHRSTSFFFFTYLSIFLFAQIYVQCSPLWPVLRLLKPRTTIFPTLTATSQTLTPVPQMSTHETIKQLVKEISSLSSSLSDAVPKGSKDDKIWSVMNGKEGDSPHETFNRRFDALFGEDCRDSGGRLHYVYQGKLGMGLVVSYLSKINWTNGFPLDLVEIKLLRLKDELKYLQ